MCGNPVPERAAIGRVGHVADEEIATLKRSEVARLCGVNTEVLRRLAEDEVLPGAVRANGGHVYLRADAVPTWQEVRDVLEAQFARHVREAQVALERVRVETEAVANDLAEAQEHPGDLLGDELEGFHAMSTAEGSQTTLRSALAHLEYAVLGVRLYNRALRQVRAVP